MRGLEFGIEKVKITYLISLIFIYFNYLEVQLFSILISYVNSKRAVEEYFASLDHGSAYAFYGEGMK